MKWRPIARTILDHLREEWYFSDEEAGGLDERLSTGEGAEMFRRLYEIAMRQGTPVGWNKMWRDGNLLGWYGPIITTQTLKATVVELITDPAITDKLRRWLNDAYQAMQDEEPYPEMPPGVYDWLQVFVLSPHFNDKSGATLVFLQQLNLKLRDLPFVERWKWSTSSGLAYLSDGGRVQVSAETVWARAIETSLSIDGRLSDSLSTFLQSCGEGQNEVVIPDEADEGLQLCLTKLESLGMAELKGNVARLPVNPGVLPALAPNLWNYKDRIRWEKK